MISSLSKSVRKWFRMAPRHTCGTRMGAVYAQTGKSPFEKMIGDEDLNAWLWYCRSCKAFQLLEDDSRQVLKEWAIFTDVLKAVR